MASFLGFKPIMFSQVPSERLHQLVHHNILVLGEYQLLASAAFPVLLHIFQRVILKQNSSSTASLLARVALYIGVPTAIYLNYMVRWVMNKNPGNMREELKTANFAQRISIACLLIGLVSIANQRFQLELVEGRLGTLLSHSYNPMFFLLLSTTVTNLFIRHQIQIFKVESAKKRDQFTSVGQVPYK